MKVEVRAIRLYVDSDGGAFTRACVFDAGLNVIRAGNSTGKTQIFQSALFALGMEDMLTGHTPLGSVFTDEISGDDGTTHRVRSSWVAVELRNAVGASMTVQRHAQHGSRRLNLMRVWHGPLLTNPGSEMGYGDYYVNEGGAATNELGFHRLLADFFGWDLPDVPRYSADPTQLYQQVLFPFFYVDQRTGWSSAGPRAVTRYQIREPTRRAAEFLLGLAGPQALAQRDALRRQLERFGQQWAIELTAARSVLSAAGGRLDGVPDHPAGLRGAAKLPTDVSSAVMLILRGDEWLTLQEEIDRLTELAKPPPQQEPTQAPSTTEQSAELLVLQDQLGASVAAASVVEGQLTLAEAQLAALGRRISGLDEERKRLVDVRKLVRLGSHDRDSHLADHHCPTCHQDLLGVEVDDPASALGLEESAAVVAAQLATVQGMKEQVERSAQNYRDSFQALQRDTDLLRVRIRALRSDLVAPEGAPSRGQVAAEVTAEVRRSELRRASESAGARLQVMSDIAVNVLEIRRELSAISSDVSADDERVIDDLTREIQEGLDAIGFGSYTAEKITLDPETLKPRRAGLDIDDDISASDVVRVKIAYLDGVRRIASQRDAPHPGFLLLDEPRQHELDEENFRAALSRLAAARADGDQVVVSSAASAETLSGYLPEEAEVTLIDLGAGRVLKPLSASDETWINDGTFSALR